MVSTKHLTIAPLCLAALLLIVGAALAAPADIDPSFSQDGRVTIDKGKSEKASSVALQPDGKLVVAGTAVYRLTTDGSADASFAGDGTAELGSSEFAKALSIQTDGKLLIGGISYRTGFVYRLNPDGTRDLGFGQNGRIGIDGGMSGSAVRALALQPDGKIIVAGQLSFNGLANAAVHRFHPNGAPDTGFGLGGIREFDNGGAEIAHAVALQRDGRIVAAGRTSVGENVAVLRLTADGSPDTSFGGDGTVTIDGGEDEEAFALALQPAGGIVVAGVTSVGLNDDQEVEDAALYRLNPDGSPDATFGAGGSVAIDGSGDEKALALALQPDGKIVAAGATSVNRDAAVFRRNPNGSPDTSFDGDGAVAIDGGETEEAHGLALQPDGKIVVAGFTSAGNNAGNNVAVYRLQGDPPPTPATPPEAPAAPTAPVEQAAPAAPSTAPTRVVRCAGRRATIVGTPGHDTIRGTARRDVIAGLAGNDTIRGLAGNDLVCGGAGKDVLRGGRGRDALRGQGGRDRLVGGAGRDRLLGGPGRDIQIQ